LDVVQESNKRAEVEKQKVEAIWIVDAHRDDGRRFIVHADEKLSAFVELEREVLTVTFYLESIHADRERLDL
jgi:hypothetical protein